MKRHVAQRTAEDCGVAAMAMFMGQSYEATAEACARASADYRPGRFTTMTLMLAVLNREDEPAVVAYWRVVDRPAILLVTSRTNPALGHALYWDGEQLHDPADPSGRTYDEAWVAANCYLQIQRLRDVVPVIAARIEKVGTLGDILAGKLPDPGEPIEARA